jgi:hypothetical protein
MPFKTVEKDGKRTCTKCKEELPLERFGKMVNGRYRKSECRKCEAKRTADRWANVDKQTQKSINQRNKRLYTYGLSPGRYEEILIEQGHRCAICQRIEPGGVGNVFHVDHCHKTQIVRGLLCSSCNIGLGNLGDNVETMLRAIEYLRNAVDRR